MLWVLLKSQKYISVKQTFQYSVENLIPLVPVNKFTLSSIGSSPHFCCILQLPQRISNACKTLLSSTKAS